MNSTLKRSVVALATTFACLLMLSSPASANPTHTADITGGKVTLKKAPLSDLVISLGGTGAMCPTGTLTLTANPHPNAEVTALNKTGTFVVGSTTYVSVITRTGSDVGTAGSGSVSSVGVDVQAKIYTLAAGTSCTPGTLRCTINTNANLEFAGTHTDADSDNEPELNDTADLDANPVGITATFPCFPPFSSYTGGTAEVNNMAVTLTS